MSKQDIYQSALKGICVGVKAYAAIKNNNFSDGDNFVPLRATFFRFSEDLKY